MQKYREYKLWWIHYKAPVGDIEEEAFEQHIKGMTLYELMEILSNWD